MHDYPHETGRLVPHSRLIAVLDFVQATGLFTWKQTLSNRAPAGAVAGKPRSRGYGGISLDGRTYPAHKLAIYWYSGIYPHEDVDHRDGNPRNNKLSNLRACGPLGNAQNRYRPSKNNTVGLLGVSLCKATGRYRAQILVEGKKLHIGRFDTAAAASTAYQAAKRQHHIAQGALDE